MKIDYNKPLSRFAWKGHVHTSALSKAKYTTGYVLNYSSHYIIIIAENE